MENKKAVILVVTHKPDRVYSDEIYTPIQVGKANSKYDLGILGDNMGDNISEKNPNYCELTAQYWAWKNLQCEYIGLCHYRRYFETYYTAELLDKVLSYYDIILPTPIYRGVKSGGIINKLISDLTQEDIAIFVMTLKKMFPDYEQDILNYLYGNVDIPFNMCICRKDLFDKYCEWEFSVLFKCEEIIRLSGYSRLKRIFGYLGEVLLPIYSYHNKLKIKHDNIVGFIGEKGENRFSKSKYLYNIFNKHHPKHIDSTMFAPAVVVGLNNDGINIF